MFTRSLRVSAHEGLVMAFVKVDVANSCAYGDFEMSAMENTRNRYCAQVQNVLATNNTVWRLVER